MACQRQRRESSGSQRQQCEPCVGKGERRVLIPLNMTVFVWLVALRSDERWISSNLLAGPFS